MLHSQASANAALQMEITSPLGPGVVKGRYSELRIRITARQPVSARLQVRDLNGLSLYPLALAQGQTIERWIAVRPTPEVDIAIGQAEVDLARKTLQFQYRASPAIWLEQRLLAELPLSIRQQDIKDWKVFAGTSSLPHTAQGYDPVSTLLIDKQSLLRLNDPQYRALADFIGRCQSLLVFGAEPQLLEALKSRAGCQGRQIDAVSELPDLPQQLARLQARRPLDLPAAPTLLALNQQQQKSSVLTGLLWFFLLYVLLLLLISKSKYVLRYNLWLALIFVIAAWLWWSGEANLQRIEWREADSGDPVSRNRQLIIAGGNRRGDYQFRYPADHRLYAAADLPHQTTRRFSDSDSSSPTLTLAGFSTLLARQLITLDSTSPVAAPISLSMANDKPRVDWATDSLAENSRLIWRGASYPITPAKNIRHWQPETGAQQPLQSAAETLLSQRLKDNEPAILIPLGQNPVDKGWQVIRIAERPR